MHSLIACLCLQLSPQGAYGVKLCKDGLWRAIVVDDFFPATNHGRRLAFAEPTRDQLWVPLLEKAMAKLHGSYRAIESGGFTEGMAILTGAPCVCHDLDGERFDEVGLT